MEALTHEKKVTYFRIAANICGFHFHNSHSDLLVSLYDKVLEKGGDLDLRTIAEVEAAAHARHPQPEAEVKNT